MISTASWIVVSITAGLVCSPDGMMAVICHFKHIQSFKTALLWAALITFFHELFGVLAAAITIFASDFEIIAMLAIRIIGIALTGYFAYESIKEALEPEEESALELKEILMTTAVVGSVDAASFAHGTAIHLAAAGDGLLSAVLSWTLSSFVVGFTTLLAGVFAWRGGEKLVREYGSQFLVIGAVLRVGLFFALTLMLVFALTDYFEIFVLSHGIQISIELLTIVVCAVLLYTPARKAQLRRL